MGGMRDDVVPRAAYRGHARAQPRVQESLSPNIDSIQNVGPQFGRQSRVSRAHGLAPGKTRRRQWQHSCPVFGRLPQNLGTLANPTVGILLGGNGGVLTTLRSAATRTQINGRDHSPSRDDVVMYSIGPIDTRSDRKTAKGAQTLRHSFKQTLQHEARTRAMHREQRVATQVRPCRRRRRRT